MTAAVIARDTDFITIEIKISLSSASLLESKEVIQKTVRSIVPATIIL